MRGATTLIQFDRERLAAVRTLQSLGYTYHGGEGWKPPLGPPPHPILKRIDDLEARLAEYRALYRWFGQDGMTDGRFVAEFERIYLADKATG